MNNSEEKLVYTYSFIQSNVFRIICFSSKIILLLIIALLKSSFYRWSINLGISLVTSGLLIVAITNRFEGFPASNLSCQNFSININDIINYGYVYIMLSVLFIIIYIIGSKVTIYNDRKYEYKALIIFHLSIYFVYICTNFTYNLNMKRF